MFLSMMYIDSNKITFENVTKTQALLLSFLMAMFYVGSLYLIKEKHGRDHPSTIKSRFMRVSIASLLACLLLYYSSSISKSTNAKSGLYLHWIGCRINCSIIATVFPLLLLAALFFGPIVQTILDQGILFFEWQYLEDITLWRNYVVAPLSEELVFRGCMMPILIPSFGYTVTIFLAPWFFGLAHLHHAIEQYKDGYYSVSQIALSTVFQACYTTLFGMLSCFIFLRTGHLASAFISHAFCNLMGFPEFSQALHHKHRHLVCSCYVIGLLLFLYMLYPLTNPSLYDNMLYATSTV